MQFRRRQLLLSAIDNFQAPAEPDRLLGLTVTCFTSIEYQPSLYLAEVSHSDTWTTHKLAYLNKFSNSNQVRYIHFLPE